MKTTLDKYDKEHFIRWCESGCCPTDAYVDPEASLDCLERWLGAMDPEDASLWIERGWRACWDAMEEKPFYLT